MLAKSNNSTIFQNSVMYSIIFPMLRKMEWLILKNTLSEADKLKS